MRVMALNRSSCAWTIFSKSSCFWSCSSTASIESPSVLSSSTGRRTSSHASSWSMSRFSTYSVTAQRSFGQLMADTPCNIGLPVETQRLISGDQISTKRNRMRFCSSYMTGSRHWLPTSRSRLWSYKILRCCHVLFTFSNRWLRWSILPWICHEKQQ